MTRIQSETKALRTYVALRDNTARYLRDEITYAAFHAEQIRLWDAVDPATTQRVLALLRRAA
jgi:hypothetical protein